MNTTQLIEKIATLVGLSKEVDLTGDVYGKLEDGTTVASDKFAVGHALFVVDESGVKKSAPDGEHNIYLPSQNGNALWKAVVKDGLMTQLDQQPKPGKQVEMNEQTKVEELPQEENLAVEEKMQEPAPDLASRLDEMAAEIKQLRDDIANLYSKMEGESENEEEMKGMKKEGKYNMSAQKKFNGAPVEEAKPLQGLIKTNKIESSVSRVFAKMANSNLK